MKKLFISLLLFSGIINPVMAFDDDNDGILCDQYNTQVEAQYKLIEYYNKYQKTNKSIDRNENGIACEHLPEWISFIERAMWQDIKYTLTDSMNGLKRKDYKTLELTVLLNTLPRRINNTSLEFKSDKGKIKVNHLQGKIVGWKASF